MDIDNDSHVITIRLPKDWSIDVEATAKILSSRVANMSNNAIDVVAQRIGWYETREDLSRYVVEIIENPDLTVIEENLLIAVIDEDNLDVLAGIVALQRSNACVQRITPEPDTATSNSTKADADHIMHAQLVDGDIEYVLDCVGHRAEMCGAQAVLDHENRRDVLGDSEWPQNCWPAQVRIEWAGTDHEGPTARITFVRRHWDIELPPGWDAVGRIGEMTPDTEGRRRENGRKKDQDVWTPGRFSFMSPKSPEREKFYVNRRHIFAHPTFQDPLDGDPREIKRWLAANPDRTRAPLRKQTSKR